MAISKDDLNLSFFVVDETTTLQEVRDRVKKLANKWVYVVVRLSDGRYAAVYYPDLIEALKSWHGEMVRDDTLAAALRDVPGLLEMLAANGVAQGSMGTSQAKTAIQSMPGRRMVVTAGGEVVGVLATTFRAAPLGADLGWLEQAPVPAAVPEAAMGAPPPSMVPEAAMGAPVAGSKAGMGVLSAEDSGDAEPPAPRFINVELLDNEEKSHDPATTPLKKGAVYTLRFDVDVKLRATAIARRNVEFAYQFQEGEQMVTITVRLESEDFDFYDGNEKKLLVARTGASKNKAGFLISPKKDGEVNMNAVFLKDGNFVQVISLKFYVGEIFTATTLGRSVDAAFNMRPRNVNLTILNMGDGFQLIMSGPVAATAKLPVTLPQLEQMIGELRTELLEVVHMAYGPDKLPIHQLKIDIPADAKDFAVQKLAKAGFGLYRKIFFGPAADQQTRLMGQRLREMAERNQLQIQIFSQQFMLPWGLLYLVERFDPGNIKPENFLGLKHIIEHIPLQPDMRVTERKIDSSAGLEVGLNVNTDIDKQMGVPLIGQQLDYWQGIQNNGGVNVKIRKTGNEVISDLGMPDMLDQILYFYCHAVSRQLGEGGGPDSSMLQMSGHTKISLDDLYTYAPTDIPLTGAPLVFINACESAELSPMFYDGFVPYFMAKGARGVIGTECETPALFAVDWMKKFFAEFLGGKPLGQIFLELRKDYFFEHNNVMGLLYALYVDGDTYIEPALAQG